MDAQNTERKAIIKHESKNRIRAEFDRSPLKDRLKAKFLNTYFISRIIIWIFRLVLMIGVAYIVLYPFLAKISGSIMSKEDFVDVTVRLIPKHFTLDIYRTIFSDLGYWTAFRNTLIFSLIIAVIQTMVCALIGYGFAKFKFKGRDIVFLLVILTIVIPHQTIRKSMFEEFRNFDVLGILRLFKGGGIEIFGHNIKNLGSGISAFFEKLNILPDSMFGQELTQKGLKLTDTYTPMIMLALSGFGFKNGLYIFLFRQFFRGIPDELEESAYIDGSGTFRTFFQIILPLSVPMLITVFLFSFCWQWTDQFYTGLFFPSNKTQTLVKVITNDVSVNYYKKLGTSYAGKTLYESAILNTVGLTIIFPLVIIYAFLQRFLVQGIEQSGLAN